LPKLVIIAQNIIYLDSSMIPLSDFLMEAGQIFILFRKTRVNNN